MELIEIHGLVSAHVDSWRHHIKVDQRLPSEGLRHASGHVPVPFPHLACSFVEDSFGVKLDHFPHSQVEMSL